MEQSAFTVEEEKGKESSRFKIVVPATAGTGQ